MPPVNDLNRYYTQLVYKFEYRGKEMLTLAITDHLITIAISIAGPIVLAILGFMLKLYSTISLHSKQLEAHDRRIRENVVKLSKMEDKQYSIVQKIPPKS